MSRLPLVLLCAAVAFGAAGCKVVKDAPEGEKTLAADASGDDARTAQRIEASFEAELVPHVTEKAVTLDVLMAALASDGLDGAGAKLGKHGSGAIAAWNFPLKGEGKVVAAALDTRARTASLDLDGNGSADVTVQLGPVVKGSALRDVAPFFNFDDFRDQIEFAKLARALNDRVLERVTLPEGDIVGQTLRFVGVVPLKKADEAVVVTPILVEVAP